MTFVCKKVHKEVVFKSGIYICTYSKFPLELFSGQLNLGETHIKEQTKNGSLNH